MRRVLLIEPGYRNKYPPLGLMKLAAYHRGRGDFVRFWKGNVKDFIIEALLDNALPALSELDASIDWVSVRPLMEEHLRLRRKKTFDAVSEIVGDVAPMVSLWLDEMYQNYRRRRLPRELRWDRVCITTLFTFHWDSTVKVVSEAKKLVKDASQLFVGGIAASLVPDEFEEATGIRPVTGFLSEPGILDDGDPTIIDLLPPDYSILLETDYSYPESDAYLSYTTRGCKRSCPFCAVPKLEGKLTPFRPISDSLKTAADEYGERRNLLLLDNNVLASPQLGEIVEEIKRAGYAKGAVFQRPNQLEIAHRGLLREWNDFGYRRLFSVQVDWLLTKAGVKDIETLNEAMAGVERDTLGNLTRQSCLELFPVIAPLFERHRYKGKMARYVDFNQGIDARLCTEESMALISQLAIKPLRVAFDGWQYRKPYEKAVRLAAKHGIRHLSNYLLYNYNERPEELWQRLELNVSLAEELDLDIYSFPMKYCPIWHEEGYHRNRDYLGPHWNRKFVRAIQSVLNATRGKISRKRDFFEKAFGRNLAEFRELLLMPENYIILRFKSEGLGLTDLWRREHDSLSPEKRETAHSVIHRGRFSHEETAEVRKDPEISAFIHHYCIDYKAIRDATSVDCLLGNR